MDPRQILKAVGLRPCLISTPALEGVFPNCTVFVSLLNLQISGSLATAFGLFVVVFPLSHHLAVLSGSNLYTVAGYILILAGIAAVVVAFCGCCGAKYENKCLLGAVSKQNI